MRREIHDGVDFGVLWRPDGASADRDLLGECESDWTAVGVRRGEAVFGGGDHGVSPLSPRGYADSAHLQHLWAADADQRWTSDSKFYVAGAAGRKSHGVWRRQPDPQFLLCQRRGRRNPAPVAVARA